MIRRVFRTESHRYIYTSRCFIASRGVFLAFGSGSHLTEHLDLKSGSLEASTMEMKMRGQTAYSLCFAEVKLPAYKVGEFLGLEG